MVHGSALEEETVLLGGQLEGGAIEAFKVEHPRVPDGEVPVHHLTAVASEPDRFICLQRFHCRRFQGGDVDVQVGDDPPLDDIAQVLHRESSADGARLSGVVNQAHVVLQGHGDKLLVEGFRCHALAAMELLLVVGPLPVESLGRVSQVGAQDGVHIGHHLFFCLSDVRGGMG